MKKALVVSILMAIASAYVTCDPSNAPLDLYSKLRANMILKETPAAGSVVIVGNRSYVYKQRVQMEREMTSIAGATLFSL
ncbi:hypothetical protein IFR04_004959 [Cadophora malorum]|uniref:Uncharacterized protein n=1 Tax=Cadophora malorum TaxID=108018 RepID=A0A8H7WBM5_9HELO|nr:hypothetical protein IFR04_004959 [Cadophora malorum]